MQVYLADESVDVCVTSPPYYGLRNYGHAGQIGMESSPQAYVEKMVEVFREVRRVLRPEGTLWLNLGDSYSPGARTTQVAPTLRTAGKDAASGKQGYLNNFTVRPKGDPWSKPKDLLGIPWRVAFALQADGWYLRQDIIWHKPNPMPESVRDRCTKAHEYIFMLSKNAKYYYDADAVAEPVAASTRTRMAQDVDAQAGSDRVPGKTNGRMKAVLKKQDGHGRRHAGFNDRYFGRAQPETRNRRSVWTVTTKPFKEAHFATFPVDLIEPCILAGSPVGGTVLDPFGGSGTTGVAALKHGRKAVLCELNKEYVEIAERRLAQAK